METNKIIESFRKNPKRVFSLILVVVGVFAWIVFSQTKTQEKPKKVVQNVQEEAVIPKIDSSVVVSLEKLKVKGEVVLKIENIPNGTSAIEYEISYQTKGQGFQGVIGTINVDNQTEYKKEITLGTCSSGNCVYHQVVGSLKLTLRFSGDYGERLFEDSFEI